MIPLMTSLTALTRTGVVAHATGATPEPFAALLAGEMPVAGSAPAPLLMQDMAAALAERPSLPVDLLPAIRQPSAATGKALPLAAVVGVIPESPAVSVADRHPGLVAPQSSALEPHAKASAAPWTPEQVRNDEGRSDPRPVPGIVEIPQAVEPSDKLDDTDASAGVVTTSISLPATVPDSILAPDVIVAPEVPVAALIQARPAPAPVAEMPRASASAEVAVGASVPIAAPQPGSAPVEMAQPSSPTDRMLSTPEAAKQMPIEGQRPVHAPAIAPARPQPDSMSPTPIPTVEQAIAAPDSPRVTPERRTPQAEVHRPSRDPLPQPVVLPAPVASPGTDRLLRARPNTAFAREEIAVTIGAATPPPPVIDVAAAHDITAAPIDTQSAEWMQSMIERIETMTGEQGQRETRLKLSPDALGEVELRLSETPDGTMVLDMDAVTPEARALLAEAAPRLVEMSEARGLRLTMQSGAQGDGQPPQQREPHRPGADSPIPNRRAANHSPGESTDERIA